MERSKSAQTKTTEPDRKKYKPEEDRTSTVCFTDLDQGGEILSKFSLPKSMKHPVPFFFSTKLVNLKVWLHDCWREKILLLNWSQKYLLTRVIETKIEPPSHALSNY